MASGCSADAVPQESLYTTGTMSTPEPELRWYQFSLRSLLLFTALTAFLCSTCVALGWQITVVIALIILVSLLA